METLQKKLNIVIIMLVFLAVVPLVQLLAMPTIVKVILSLLIFLICLIKDEKLASALKDAFGRNLFSTFLFFIFKIYRLLFFAYTAFNIVGYANPTKVSTLTKSLMEIFQNSIFLLLLIGIIGFAFYFAYQRIVKNEPKMNWRPILQAALQKKETYCNDFNCCNRTCNRSYKCRRVNK